MKLVEQVQIAQRLVHGPGSVGVETKTALGSDDLTYRAHHLVIGSNIEAHFDIKHPVAAGYAVAALCHQALFITPGEIVKVVRSIAHSSAEEVVERLIARPAANIPQRHIDPGVREAGGGFAKHPDSLVPQVG